ncbi:SNARE Sft1 [Schizosaccharomyces cryophilus OY26]|uniref:SNARE Sft1 n=1 Tax=Schizosaccharomyces cryophilus (strain OY26 / ATCC MYA-4695 / CBS 11777 / NBRC 106824 / NRRL Y48691) TaxID=653667 RepID=S9VU22_SCHCR|nr:SNARE Sft1 [Schizosaccharomyces cryophilus OY26]EPY49684.1 SNARE Sft1 [Schizosaccharomyces cryophilus OY26]
MNDPNERRLETLSGQITSLKNITYDIYTRASDYSHIDRANEGFSGLSDSVKRTTNGFFRVVRNAGRRSIFTTVLAIVGSVLIFYYLCKYFL